MSPMSIRAPQSRHRISTARSYKRRRVFCIFYIVSTYLMYRICINAPVIHLNMRSLGDIS
jgi:hypothetical protein